MTLSPQSNNFDFLRIAAALMVLVSHQQPLTGRAEWSVLGWQSLGGIGLLMFFTMSGFLVCESWQRDPNIVRFTIRRLLRIWPALAVVVLLTALVFGPLMSTLPVHVYFLHPSTWGYLQLLEFKDAFLLPGVFTSNPTPAVNGSLWTLPIEVRWYGYLAVAGLLGALRWRSVLLVVTLGIAVHYFFVFDIQRVLSTGGSRGWKEELGVYFLAGACLQRYRAEWEDRRRWLGVVVSCVAGLLAIFHQVHAALWLLLPTAVIVVALQSCPVMRSVARRGDFSYGFYLYAFPVQQTIVALTANTLSYGEGLAVSILVTALFAVASWYGVEAPAIRLKPSKGAGVSWLPAMSRSFLRRH